MMNSGGQGGRPRKSRSSSMNNSNSNARCRSKESMRPAPHRPPLEAEGIYADPKYAHVVTSVIGCSVQVLTTAQQLFEGVLESVSSDNETVLGMVNLVHMADPKKIDPAEVKDKLIFKTGQIVTMTAKNVDPEYAVKSGFQTDSAISGKTNGSAGVKELQPWIEDDDVPSNRSLSLDSSQNGWDARDMFEANERKFQVGSSYDHSMAGYTTPLQRGSRDQEASAARIAEEIERGGRSRDRTDQNGDEEAVFAAVRRPSPGGGGGGDDAGRPDRYVPPARRQVSREPPAGPRLSAAARGAPSAGRPRTGPPPGGPQSRPGPAHHGGHTGRPVPGRGQPTRIPPANHMHNAGNSNGSHPGRLNGDDHHHHHHPHHHHSRSDPRSDHRGDQRMQHRDDHRPGHKVEHRADHRSDHKTQSELPPRGPDRELSAPPSQQAVSTAAAGKSPTVTDSESGCTQVPPSSPATEQAPPEPAVRRGDVRQRTQASPQQPPQRTSPPQQPAQRTTQQPRRTPPPQQQGPPRPQHQQRTPPPPQQHRTPPPQQPRRTPPPQQQHGGGSGNKSVIAGLKDFRHNFVLSEEPARREEPPRKTPTPTSKAAETGEAAPTPSRTPETKAAGEPAVEKAAASLAKSKLNPNAKSFTPSQPASLPTVAYSPAPTPPARAMTPQAVMPSQFQPLLQPAGHPNFNYIMAGQPFSMPQQPPRMQKQRGEFPAMGGVAARAEASPVQVAAVTGQPLMAPSPMATHSGGPHLPLQMPQPGLVPPGHQYPGQMIVRMMPTAHAGMYQQQQQQPPQQQGGSYDGQQGAPPPAAHQLAAYGLLAQPAQAGPPQPPTPGPGPGQPAPVMYPMTGGAGGGVPYPPNSMYLVSAGQPMQPAQLAMMQAQPFPGAAAAAAAAAMTSQANMAGVPLHPQPYYIPHAAAHPAQPYGPGGVHPMPLVPNPNHQ